MNYIKDLQAKTQSKTIKSKDLIPFFSELLKRPGNGRSQEQSVENMGSRSGRSPKATLCKEE